MFWIKIKSKCFRAFPKLKSQLKYISRSPKIRIKITIEFKQNVFIASSGPNLAPLFTSAFLGLSVSGCLVASHFPFLSFRSLLSRNLSAFAVWRRSVTRSVHSGSRFDKFIKVQVGRLKMSGWDFDLTNRRLFYLLDDFWNISYIMNLGRQLAAERDAAIGETRWVTSIIWNLFIKHSVSALLSARMRILFASG